MTTAYEPAGHPGATRPLFSKRFPTYLLAFLGLTLMSGAYRTIVVVGGDLSEPSQYSEGNIRFQLVSGTLYLLALVALLNRWRTALAILRDNSLAISLLAFVIASALWSVLPGTSFRRAIALLLSTGFVVFLAARFEPRELLRLLGFTLLVHIAISVLAIIGGLPDTVHQTSNEGAWRAFSGQKNYFGRLTSISTIVFIALWLHDKRWRYWAIAGLILAIPALVMSQSRSSWLACIAGVSVVVYFSLFLRPGRIESRLKLALAVLIGSLALLTAILLADIVLSALGRDFKFSGRTRIWEPAIQVGLENHPFLGAGFGAFWTEAGAQLVYARLLETNFNLVGNAHNALLEAWLDLGFVGLGLLVATIFAAMFRAFSLCVRGDPYLSGFYCAVILALAIYAFSEPVLIEHSDLPWALLLLALFHSGQRLAERLRK